MKTLNINFNPIKKLKIGESIQSFEASSIICQQMTGNDCTHRKMTTPGKDYTVKNESIKPLPFRNLW